MVLLLSVTLYCNSLLSQVQIGQDIDGESAGDQSGISVSISSNGNRVAIGSRLNDGNGSDSGQTRIFEYSGGNWSQIGNDINGEAAGDECGQSVVISSNGTRVAVGAPNNNGNGNNSGHVRVYDFINGNWSQVGGDIDGETMGDRSGWSISLSEDGNRIAVGAIYNDANGNDSGHVRVYDYINGNWTQLGGDIDGEDPDDYFGWSVSLSYNGNRLAVGAPKNDGGGGNSGSVKIFEMMGGNWVQIGANIDGSAAFDECGTSVSLSSSGERVAVGAPLNNNSNGADAGQVRVFEFINNSWTQVGSNINGEALSDHSGNAVSLSHDGSLVAIGAPGNGNAGGGDAGQVRIYEFNGNSWNQLGNDIDGEGSIDLSGTSVSLTADGTKVAIGAPFNNGNGTESGHVRVYGSFDLGITSFDANAVKVFPIPTRNKFKISGIIYDEIRLSDVMGRTQFQSSKYLPEVDISKIPIGVYFLELRLKGQRITKKILKE